MSHLPLLFADGQPTCLENITQTQLERFIPFMVQCCPKRDNKAPFWWPKQLPFSFPLKPTSNLIKCWVPFLKELVVRCYKYYDCLYILVFCRKLAQLGTKRLILKENSDRVDIIERTSSKLLVSVKAKNKTYDQPQASPHKSLLPRPLVTQTSYKSQPIDDIYLCTYCDAEFTCCKDACDHENEAHSESVAEEQSTPQESVLRSIGLVAVGKVPTANVVRRRQRRIASNLNLKKCLSVPLCSPLGSLLLANNDHTANTVESLSKVEEFCATRDVPQGISHQSTRRSRRVPGSTSLPHRLRQPIWTHEYCFNRKQREEREITIRTGLNVRARRLLRQCRDMRVTIRRLPPVPGNTTIDLRMLKRFIAEEFPGQDIFTKVAVVPPVLAASGGSRQPTSTPTSTSASNGAQTNPMVLSQLLGIRIPAVKRVLANKVPPNQILSKPSTAKRTQPNSGPAAAKAGKSEPILIDLCSSDEECEIIPVPAKVEVVSPTVGSPTVGRPGSAYPSHVHLPKYGVTAASPEATPPRTVAETEFAGIPETQPTVVFGPQYCRTRS